MSRVFFLSLFFLGLCAPFLSNDRPFLVNHGGRWYFPMFKHYAGQEFGLDQIEEPDYLQFSARAVFPPIRSGPYRTFEGAIPPSPPSREHWLGTDDRGRDLLSRLLYGLRNSLLFATATTLLNLIFAGLLGSVSAYFGKHVDLVTQRALEIVGALPPVFLFLAMASLGYINWLTLILLWGGIGCVTFVQYVRGEVLRLKESDFVAAAQASGVGYWGLFGRHFLPNAAPILLGLVPFLFVWNIYVLTGLDYLGIGLPPPEPGLGDLIAQGRQNLDAWWLVWSPIAVISALLISLHRMASALRVKLDVKRYSTERFASSSLRTNT